MIGGTGPAEGLRASVCIPTRNRERRLRLMLESLARQSVPPSAFEVVVADDGSVDGTAELLQRFAALYELRGKRLPGYGSGAARNAAAGAAKHEVLIFLDDDQVASTDLVAAHLRAHQGRDSVMVQGNYPLAPGPRHRGTSLTLERSRERAWRSLTGGDRGIVYLWGGNVSIRRETWRRLGGFDENLPRRQDLDLGLRLAAQGVTVVAEAQAVSYHLHAATRLQFRRNSLTEGRCTVRIARKHGMTVASLLGGSIDRPIDQLVTAVWRRSPRAADLAGGGLASLLWLADLIGLPPAQVFAARLVRRFYELGGIAVESSAELTQPKMSRIHGDQRAAR